MNHISQFISSALCGWFADNLCDAPEIALNAKLKLLKCPRQSAISLSQIRRALWLVLLGRNANTLALR